LAICRFEASPEIFGTQHESGFMSQLENLLQQCTVKLTFPGRVGWGTGFFVAPKWILTCAHVVQEVQGQPVQVWWQKQENWGQAVVEQLLPDPYDLALLRVTLPADAKSPCVYLDEVIQSRDPLYLFGYPDQHFPNGCPVTFSCEGMTGDEPALIKFALGQVRPGMSGSPLLNQQTGKVCGMVKFTRDRSIDLGGGAISARVILEQFPQLRDLQREFHGRDRRWSSLVAKPSDTAHPPQSDDLPSAMAQTNFDGQNYQTQTGANSKNFIGGEHYHHVEQSEGKQTVKKILMLSANPENTDTSRRRAEIKKVKEALRRAKFNTQFELHDGQDITTTDFSQEIQTIEPYIIDIAGCENGIKSLVLEENPDKTPSENSEKIIARSFKLHEKSIECVILNSCYLEKQAREIVQYIPFVIGISQGLSATQILAFLNEFYFYLGSGRTVRDAYEAGCLDLQKKRVDDAWIPILLNKDDEIKHRLLEIRLNSHAEELEKRQDDVELWMEKANLLTELGRAEEVNEAYEKASSLDSNNYEIRIEQGDALEQLGEPEKAIAAYREALVLEDQDYKVWWKKGQALVEVEKHDEAVESYRTALKLKPHSPDSYIICREYACLLAKLGQHQESIALYKKSLGFEPNYRVSSYEKKQLYKKMYSREG